MKKKKLIKVFVVVDILAIILAGIVIFSLSGDKEDTDVIDNSGQSETTVVKEEKNYDEYTELWKSNKAINEDYLGNIRFESGIIDLPFVKSVDNDDYLRRDF